MTATHSTHDQEVTDTSRKTDLRGLYAELKLALEYRPIESLKPYATNPRTHSRQQLKVLTESIGAFGCVAPVIVDENDTIVGGHGVLLAAKELGYAEVPVVRLTHLGEAEKKVIRIALNRSAELAGWDHKLLALEFSSLLDIDTSALSFNFDLSLTGFSLPEIDRIIDEGGAEEDGDEFVQEPDRREPPVSRPGDLWVLDEHRLINGDARDPATYAALLGDERAAVGLHDVPYNCRTNEISKSKRHPDFIFAHGELSEAEFTAFLTEFLQQAKAHSKLGAVTFAFIDWRHMGEMLNAGRSAGLGLCNVCIWDKGAGALGSLYRSQHEMVFVFADPGAPILNNVQLGRFGRNRTNVWSWPGARSLRKELQLHPTPKPVGLLAEAIRDVSNRGDVVLDSFSGSGSTIIAAAKTGRRGFAIELDPHYVDVGVLRWQEWSGGIARQADTGLTFEEVKAVRRAEASCEGLTAAPGDHSKGLVPARVRHRVRPVQGTGGGR
jgi:DNA methylase/ParB-like nuclease domain